MRIIKVTVILMLFCGFCMDLSGWPGDEEITKTLENLFIRLRQAEKNETRITINDSIRSIIDSYSVSDSVFSHRFSSVKFLGQVTAPDSLVKIINWNMIVNDGISRYYCNIIRREDRKAKPILYRLDAPYNSNGISEEKNYSQADWYGALYYDLKPFNFNGSVKYAILGIDYGNTFITRKFIDVLSFDGNGNLQFGLKCFTDGKNVSQRVLFEYSSSAVMSLRFEADDMIVFDHLSPFSPELKGNRQFYGPDFSFDAYKFEKGMWWLKSDIDIKNR